MVPKWKRLIYSLIGALAGSGIFAVLSLFLPGKSGSPIALFLVVTLVTLAVSLSGWLIAVPIVLMVNNIAGWRFWFYLFIGSSLGPLATSIGTILPFLRSYRGGENQTQTVVVILAMSILVSGTATLCYLLLLRRAQKALTASAMTR